MTERCQNKFQDNFEINTRKYTIYIGVLVGSLAVLYFYRFQLAIIVLSYLLGFLGCYYCVNSRSFTKYIEQFNYQVTDDAQSQASRESSVKSCDTCGSARCSRHDAGAAPEPWAGLLVHKQLDQAIQDLYNGILEQFVSSWYSKVSPQPFLVDELRYQLRYASARLLRRIMNCDVSAVLLHRLLPCALHSVRTARAHPAARDRRTELAYLRALTTAVMPLLLKESEIHNDVFRVLVRELVSGWALLPMCAALSAPYTAHTALILATDPRVSSLPDTPDYQVEFLETFARQSERWHSARASLWRVPAASLSEPDTLYALLQHLRSSADLRPLQLYTDIKSFQSSILQPELSPDQLESLGSRALALCSLLPTDAPLAEQLQALVNGETGSVKRLQTSPALYEMARQSHDYLEKVVLPRFLHSEEFYKLMIGSRLPTGYQKQNNRSSHKSLNQPTAQTQALQQLCARAASLDVPLLSCLQTTDDVENDLSGVKVALTHVQLKEQVPPRRGTVRVFTLAVHRYAASGADGASGAALWSVHRSEHDFHLLRTKLIEFHGEEVLHQLVLPNRRDNSPLETLRYKYEDFLQRLLRRPLLQASQLLALFLAPQDDFSFLLGRQSASGAELAHVYHALASRLTKQRGQHLAGFLHSYLHSTDLQRKAGTQVEEGIEVIEDAEPASSPPPAARDLESDLVQDGGAPTPVVTGEVQTVVGGFTACFVFFLRAQTPLLRILLGAMLCARGWVDARAQAWLRGVITRTLCQRRLARLVVLAKELVLCGRPPASPEALACAAHTARARVSRAPTPLVQPLHSLLDAIQDPHQNKQLVYHLLDLCVLELFPELDSLEAKSQPETSHES